MASWVNGTDPRALLSSVSAVQDMQMIQSHSSVILVSSVYIFRTVHIPVMYYGELLTPLFS